MTWLNQICGFQTDMKHKCTSVVEEFNQGGCGTNKINIDIHHGVCAICLNKIVLQETALIKGCEHAYWFVWTSIYFVVLLDVLCWNVITEHDMKINHFWGKGSQSLYLCLHLPQICLCLGMPFMFVDLIYLVWFKLAFMLFIGILVWLFRC